MGEIIIKFLLLILVTMPFVALWSDVWGRTEGLMFRVLVGVNTFMVLTTLMGSFQHRPIFANFVFVAFCAWPIALLVAKAVRPSMTWYSLWVSVPMMSWFLVNLMIGLTDGGAFRGMVGLLLGWVYMVLPFAVLSGIFVGVQVLIKRIRSGT